ncbi:class D beta-lactamase [Methylocaldum szegediense]|jgi:beta-lactamase class D|uniref:Beta-lactamase n=1 Tax=Methylocaldum szegediense TaxID=73780 RepID=A0ABN8X933_9GAMM|nr:class D beta-lactamase [Methylocaldum szegediense]CAI8860437.1 putative beta-lactamase YbxI [Methylocaldum szegediense]
MDILKRFCLLASLCLCAAVALGDASDLSKFFKNTPGAFVLYDLKNDRYLRYNPVRCKQRFTPHSTFKIPNSLIGLETGVIPNADFVIPWDRQQYPPEEAMSEEWNRDHDLRSAIKYSVVWYYRELAKRVGEARMKKMVQALRYGNQDISGGIDRFWLNSSLAISANEQVAFLKRFYAEKLPVSQRSVKIVKDILVLEKTPEYTLSGKTGGGPRGDGKYLGWFVGYLETRGNVYFFATNVDGDNFAAIREPRVTITRQILTNLGYLPH